MNKEDILNRSKNQYSDEREKLVEDKVGANVFYTIFLCNLVLVMVISFQMMFTGEAFADPDIFLFAVLTGLLGNFATKYYYFRERRFLIFTVCSAIFVVACFMRIILN